MSRDSRTWTVAGRADVEARLDALTAQAARALSVCVPSGALATLAVIGGYGRGEGGVERVGDEYRPHNNVDLLLVTRGLRARRRAQLARDLDDIVARIADQYQVPIDLGVIGIDTLRRARKQVLWYDLREGHRTIAGDTDLLRSLVRFSADDLDPRDVRDLVVNRGTLLLINFLALARLGRRDGGLAESWRKRIVRHAMKAVVGYGDALLYAGHAYHYSYREKQRRVRRCQLIDDALARAYERAIEFRFQPDYQSFADTDLVAWHAQLLATLEPAHRRFLGAIHGRELAWREYPTACLTHSLSYSARSVRDWARAGKHALATRGRAPVSELRLRALYALSSPRDRMAAIFPAACYGLGTEHPLARALLGDLADSTGAGDGDGETERRRRFLALWAIHGDVNIPDDVRALSLPDLPHAAHVVTDTRPVIRPEVVTP